MDWRWKPVRVASSRFSTVNFSIAVGIHGEDLVERLCRMIIKDM
jgi:hypothetical protein